MHELIQIVSTDHLIIDQQQQQKVIEEIEFLIPHFSKTWDQLIFYINEHPDLLLTAEAVCKRSKDLKIKSSSLIELKIYLLEYHLYGSRRMDKYEQFFEEINSLISETPELDKLTWARFQISKVYSRSLYNNRNKVDLLQQEEKINKAIEIYLNTTTVLKEQLRALTSAAQFYLFQGELLKALYYIKKGEKIIQNVTCVNYENLFNYTKALILTEQGNFEQANSIVDNLLSTIKLDWAFCLKLYIMNLKAVLLTEMKNNEKALYWAQQTYEQGKKYFGDTYNDIVSESLMVIAKCNLYKKDFEGAEKAVRESIFMCGKYFGEQYKHADQANAHIVLGDILQEKELFSQAQQEYKTAEEIYNNIYQDKQSDNLSKIYYKLAINGIRLNDQVLATYYLNLHRKYFGDKHPETLKIAEKIL